MAGRWSLHPGGPLVGLGLVTLSRDRLRAGSSVCGEETIHSPQTNDPPWLSQDVDKEGVRMYADVPKADRLTSDQRPDEEQDPSPG